MATNKQIIEFQGKGIAKLKTQYAELEKRTKDLEGATKRNSKSLGGMVAALGLTTAALYATSRAISSTVRVGANFQKTMSNVAAISGATGSDLAALEKNAKDLGASTAFTASQVGELQTEFAKLGFTSKEIQGVTKDTLALAAASGSDLATSAMVAGQTLRAFGLDVSETSRVTDTMAASFSRSALDMEKFSFSMQYVAPIARQVGIDVESTTAMLGTLANAGIDGSMAGTALRKILLELGNESSKVGKKLGFSVESSEDLERALKRLNEMGLGTTEMSDLVGQRAVSAFGILLNGVGTTNQLADGFKNAGGTAQEMADVQLDNLSGKTTILGSAMEGLGLSIFEHFSPSLEDAVEGMTSLVGTFNDFIKIPTSDKIIEEQTEFNALVGVLKNANTEQSTRNEVIDTLQKNYSNYIGNMDLESASIQQIADLQKTANAEFEKKIKLAANEEILQKALKETKDIQLELAEAEVELARRQNEKQQAYNAFSPSLGNTNAGLRGQEVIVNDLKKELSEAIAEYSNLQSTLNDLGYSVDASSGTITTYGDKVKTEFTEKTEDAGSAAANAKEEIEGLAELIELLNPRFEEVGGKAIITSRMVFEAQRQQVEDTLAQYSQVTDNIMNLSDQYTAFEMQNIDNRRQKEIDAAMASGLNEEAKQAKIQNIKEKYAKQERDLQKKQKAPMIAQAIANTALGVTKALGQEGVLGIISGALIAAAGAVEVATIQAQEFATGGQFVTNGPEMIKVGDNPSGRELVEITPLGGDPNINGPQGRGVTLNISAPLVDETVVDAIIPALEKANRMNLA